MTLVRDIVTGTALVVLGIAMIVVAAGFPQIGAVTFGPDLFPRIIAGGLILFLFALSMIFGQAMNGTGAMTERGDGMPAIFPLAVPSLASPGAMLAIVLLTDNHRFSIPEQAVTALVMLAVLGAALVMMLLAGPILRVIRRSGAAIVSRVMGMVLAAVAVDNVIEAVRALIEGW